jgi:hypothetical protein
MTEGERAFYKLRLRQELQQAKAAGNPELREWHIRWVQFYEDRLDGKKTPAPHPRSPYEGVREMVRLWSAGIGAPLAIPVHSAEKTVIDSDAADVERCIAA